MEVKLKTIAMRNFKRYQEQTIDFACSDAVITGKNGYGKTTIWNAYLWCLCGCDIESKADGSVIRPIGQPVEVIPEVSVTLSIDGTDTVFTRKLEPTYTGRGIDKVYKGDKSSCYIDELPVNVTEFTNRLSQIFPKSTLIWADTLAFCDDSKFKAEDRRNLLIECFGQIDDETIRALKPEYDELFTAKGKHSVEDFKAIQKEREKNCNAELGRGKTAGTLQSRIDEAARAITRPELTIEGATAKIAEVQEKIKASTSGANNEAKQKLAMLIKESADISEKLSETVKAIRSNLISKAQSELQSASVAFKTAKTKEMELANAIQDLSAKIARTEERLTAAKAEMQTLESTTPKIDEVCPACGQPLPKERIEEAIANYNEIKSNKLSALEDVIAECDTTIMRKELAKLQDERKEALKSIEALEMNVRMTDEKLHNAYLYEVKEDEYPADLKKRSGEINNEIESLQLEIQMSGSGANTEALSQELLQAQSELSIAENNKRQKDRIAELQARQKAVAEELSEAQRFIALCDDFVLYKAHFIEQSISSHFDGVTFKLFDFFKNGEIKNACTAIVDGKPYRLLSFSQKILASVAVLNGLSKHYGFYAPMFLDNCSELDTQSINSLATKSQKIIIKVSDMPIEINSMQ